MTQEDSIPYGKKMQISDVIFGDIRDALCIHNMRGHSSNPEKAVRMFITWYA